MRVLNSIAVGALVVCSTAPVFAAQPTVLGRDFGPKLRSAARLHSSVKITGIDLGDEKLSTLTLEPMKVWADDARIAVHGPDGKVETIDPPRILSFKGQVDGDPDSAVYVGLSEDDGRVTGSIMHGAARFNITTGRRLSPVRDRNDVEDPVVVREIDPVENTLDAEPAWSCPVENMRIPRTSALDTVKKRITSDGVLEPVSNAGNVSGASYTLKLAIETDTELYVGFGSNLTNLTNYITTLVGQASVIYQRDLSTTLTVGHTNFYTGGTDPWTHTAADGVYALLAELGTYYHNTNTVDYSQVQRSAVVWVSGRGTNAGLAWTDQLCSGDLFCGATGATCGSATFANAYAGGYAFVGSFAGLITTTVPDPNATVNGVQYGLPNNNNYWILDEFAHELGHVVSAQHTHCVALSSAEKTLYSVTRDFVDLCASGECYVGTTSAPPELGTIMSYCHNITSGGFRQSRYLFGKAGEPSSKMLSILKNGDATTSPPTTGLEGATPNPTMTTEAAPLTCSAGRTASVASCTGCTYAWQITGGSITSSTTINSITYTPSASSVTLTVTVTSAQGCGISVSKTLATSCGAVSAPTNVLATATSSSNIQVTWTASAGATSYNVYRTADNVTYSMVSTPGAVTGTTYNDPASSNKAYKYKVRAVNGGESGDSNADFAVALVFTDPTITALSTPVKAVHITELRTCLNALRTLNANQVAFSFTDPTLTTGVTTAKAVHISELQTQINTVRTALGFSTVSFTETPTATVTPVKKTHIDQLRAAVQ